MFWTIDFPSLVPDDENRTWVADATSRPKKTSYMQASSSHVGQGGTDSLEVA